MHIKKILFSLEVFVIFLCLTLYIWYTTATNDRQKQAQITEISANQLKNGIESFVNEKISVLLQVRNFLLNSDVISHERFLSFCREIIGQTPGFQAIEYENNSSKVVWIEPFMSSEPVGRFSESSEPLRQAILNKAVQDKSVKITPTLDLQEGGKGFIAIVPLFRKGVFEGSIYGFFKTDTVFDLIFDTRLRERYQCMIFDGTKPVFATEGATVDQWARTHGRIEKILEIRDYNWSLRLWPKESKSQGGYLGIAVLVFGLGLSTVLGSLVWVLSSKAELADVYAAMLEVSHMLSASTEIVTVLRGAGDACLRMTGVDRCAILLWNPETRQLEPGWISNVGEEITQRFLKLKLPYGETTIVNQLVDEKKSLRVHKAAELMELLPPTVTYSLGIKSLLAVPIMSKGNLVGAILLDRANERHRFSALEQSVVEGIANHAATAIENARLLAESQRQSDLIVRNNMELESLLSIVSQDLKGPLLSLKGMMGLLNEESGETLSEAARHYLCRMNANVGQMESLLVNVLEFSKIGRESTEKEMVNVPEVLQEVLSDLEARNGCTRVKLVNQNEVDHICYNRHGLKRIFLNLIDNAIKFSSYQEDAEVVIGSEQLESETRFFVQDNGIGIDKKHHEHIFDLFSRLRELKGVEGIGVGLAVVKRVVQTYGGNVWLESEKGKGTTVFVSIPDYARS